VQRITAACSALLVSAALTAQAQTPSPNTAGFEKKNYNYSEWTKGLFSEVVTVAHPGKMIFLAGVGAEDESGARGAIRHLGDVAGQCHYAYDKIKRLLAMHGATMNDVVKVVTYVTDVRYLPEVGKCRTEALAGAPQPVHTFLNINQLAWPGMLVEVDAIAVAKEP
jgi:enamine deaminase RidA (YjgF/YER057c/UK114 family)